MVKDTTTVILSSNIDRPSDRQLLTACKAVARSMVRISTAKEKIESAKDRHTAVLPKWFLESGKQTKEKGNSTEVFTKRIELNTKRIAEKTLILNSGNVSLEYIASNVAEILA